MATHYTPDDREAALKLYQVNHLENGTANERYFWFTSRGLANIPTGFDTVVGRDAQIVAAAAALGVTVNEDSPWKREQQFWANWLAKPPTAAP